MITYLTGNILESEAEALVNTVNCEGFMGKGLAYQFKKTFPETNKSYISVCKQGELHPGKLHYEKEHDKFIINFPTKDKWREKSKIEYIEKGMNALIELLEKKHIKSIAIPPLGSGNGGLNWQEVKKIVSKYIFPLSNEVEFYIYEPSLNYKAVATQAPKLTLSHYILMNIKQNLTNFSKLRLQKAAFFINLFTHQDYFKFIPHHYGPYSHSIDILSRDIKEFQEYHKFNTEQALKYAYNTLISKKTEEQLNNFLYALERATQFLNLIPSNKDLELYATICFIVLNNKVNTIEHIVSEVHKWSEEKKEKFSKEQITIASNYLVKNNILHKNIFEEYTT